MQYDTNKCVTAIECFSVNVPTDEGVGLIHYGTGGEPAQNHSLTGCYDYIRTYNITSPNTASL